MTCLYKEHGGRGELFTEQRMQREAFCWGIGKVLLAALPVGVPVSLRDADGATIAGVSLSLLGRIPDSAEIARMRDRLEKLAGMPGE